MESRDYEPFVNDHLAANLDFYRSELEARYRDLLAASLGPADLDRVRIVIRGSMPEGLTPDVEGPDDLVQKAREILGLS